RRRERGRVDVAQPGVVEVGQDPPAQLVAVTFGVRQLLGEPAQPSVVLPTRCFRDRYPPEREESHHVPFCPPHSPFMGHWRRPGWEVEGRRSIARVSTRPVVRGRGY